MVVAFFDFDGTLTKKDSLPAFLKFYFSPTKFIVKSIQYIPNLILFKAKLISNATAKERLFTTFFKGENETDFEQKAADFSATWIDKNLNPLAIEKLNWHQMKGHKLYIVSASISDYLQPWCKKNNIKLISTELAKGNGNLTGSFATENCYGPEKVKRIKNKIDFKALETSFGYGDSKGDKEMLAFVDKAFYRKF